MVRQLLHRLGFGAVVVFSVVSLTFALINLAPGDPARLWVAPDADAATIQAARDALGLDRPIPIRLVRWIGAFITGDWGTSLATQRPVTQVLADALPATLLLAAASLAVTYLGGIVLGVIQAMRHRTAMDTGLTVLTLIIYAMPAYWLALMMVLLFTYATARFGLPMWLRFPAFGDQGLDAAFLTPMGRLADRLRHLALPLATLGFIGIAGITRFVRGAVLDVRQQDFVRTAIGKGLPKLAVEVRHILRNALVPIVTLLGLSLPALVSGAVFVEVIFAWPGMGRVMVDAVGARDYPVVAAATALFAVLVVIGNLLADIGAAIVDPRLRTTR